MMRITKDNTPAGTRRDLLRGYFTLAYGAGLVVSPAELRARFDRLPAAETDTLARVEAARWRWRRMVYSLLACLSWLALAMLPAFLVHGPLPEAMGGPARLAALLPVLLLTCHHTLLAMRHLVLDPEVCDYRRLRTPD